MAGPRGSKDLGVSLRGSLPSRGHRTKPAKNANISRPRQDKWPGVKKGLVRIVRGGPARNTGRPHCRTAQHAAPPFDLPCVLERADALAPVAASLRNTVARPARGDALLQ